jgi:succinoglycan biosynthesis transport protein ExoP
LLIGGLVAIGTVGTFWFSSSQPKIYSSASEIRISSPGTSAIFNSGVNGSNNAQRDFDTELQTIQSSDTRRAVNQAVGPAAQKVQSVRVAGIGQTDVIEITVTSHDRSVAQRTANAYATVIVNAKRTIQSESLLGRAAQLQDQATALQPQLDQVNAQLQAALAAQPESKPGIIITPTPQITQLENQQAQIVTQQFSLVNQANQFRLNAASTAASVQIVQTAQLPTVPIGPHPIRSAALAATIALLLGIGLSFFLERIDDRVRDRLSVEPLLGKLPVLGAIPISSTSKRAQWRMPHGPLQLVPSFSNGAEAYRAVQTALRFSNLNASAHVIAVTSARAGEGKTTLVANLAIVFCEAGFRVVVISGDLRRPAVSSLFSVEESGVGLCSVLTEDSVLGDALRNVDLSDGNSLRLLPSGLPPRNPSELLGSAKMGNLLQELRNCSDIVLLDLPPVLPVSDALVVSKFVDSVLVLSVFGKTRKRDLSHTLGLLQGAGSPVAGVILNGIPTRRTTFGVGRYYGRSGYGYGYGYGRRYDDRYLSQSKQEGSHAQHYRPKVSSSRLRKRPTEFGSARSIVHQSGTNPESHLEAHTETADSAAPTKEKPVSQTIVASRSATQPDLATVDPTSATDELNPGNVAANASSPVLPELQAETQRHEPAQGTDRRTGKFTENGSVSAVPPNGSDETYGAELASGLVSADGLETSEESGLLGAEPKSRANGNPPKQSGPAEPKESPSGAARANDVVPVAETTQVAD